MTTAANTALISGTTGQDGAYLAELLLARSDRVVGTSRDAQVSNLKSLGRLGIRSRVEAMSMAPNS